jgi:hypothetical protein
VAEPVGGAVSLPWEGGKSITLDLAGPASGWPHVSVLFDHMDRAALASLKSLVFTVTRDAGHDNPSYLLPAPIWQMG